jgi:hypothetical protein
MGPGSALHHDGLVALDVEKHSFGLDNNFAVVRYQIVILNSINFR